MSSAEAAPATAVAPTDAAAAPAVPITLHYTPLPSGQPLHCVYLRGISSAQLANLKAQVARGAKAEFAVIRGDMVSAALREAGEGFPICACNGHATQDCSSLISRDICLPCASCTPRFASWWMCSSWSAPQSSRRCRRCAESSRRGPCTHTHTQVAQRADDATFAKARTPNSELERSRTSLLLQSHLNMSHTVICTPSCCSIWDTPAT